MLDAPDPEILKKALEMRMPFGKHKGTYLIYLPEPYLAWFDRNGWPEGKLGMYLQTVFVIRTNGLMDLIKPLLPR